MNAQDWIPQEKIELMSKWIIVYNIKTKSLNQFKDNGQPLGPQWSIVETGVPDVFADSFFWWHQKVYDNKNLKLSDIKTNWEIFFEAYRYISMAERINKI